MGRHKRIQKVKELKPCPFCGRSKQDTIQLVNQNAVVVCDHCDAHGPWAGTHAGAGERWNERGVVGEALLKIILPGVVTPSNNELLKMHHMAVHRLKGESVCWLKSTGAHDQKYKVKPGEKRRVEFSSFRHNKLDTGNLAGGFKKLEDALVEIGLLVDDSEKYAEITYSQKIDRKAPRTEILIFEGE